MRTSHKSTYAMNDQTLLTVTEQPRTCLSHHAANERRESNVRQVKSREERKGRVEQLRQGCRAIGMKGGGKQQGTVRTQESTLRAMRLAVALARETELKVN